MGAYAYCQKLGCERGIPSPGIREAVSGKTRCYAGHENDLDHQQEALISILLEMQEQIEFLRIEVDDLKDRVPSE